MNPIDCMRAGARWFSPLPLVLLLAMPASSALAQQVEVESFMLDNGMEFLLLPRKEQRHNIACGWVAKVGSVNERPGITGISHFFEHMMFKGTSTIGTTDAAADADFRARQEAVKRRINDLVWHEQYQRYFDGVIDDPWDPANDTDELRTLRAELSSLIEAHRAVIENGEFADLYSRNGGSMLNAFTSNDVTFYIVSLPSNRFELWAWMESDRLLDPSFREFYAERDVVHEERRLRLESTPTGIYDEQFDAMFWQSSPYHWSVIGWPSDLNSYTMEQARSYFDTYYQPGNLVGVVVGDFEPDEIKPVIEAYFGRLEPAAAPPPPVVTLEIDRVAEMRMIAEIDGQSSVRVRYRTVPPLHPDAAPLEIMGGVLNGRTGRLYKAMVEGAEIASSASGGSGQPMRYVGEFAFAAEVKGDADPETLEEAWYEELRRMQDEPVPDRELQKVRNQVVADNYRRLQNNFFLMIQLGYIEALGGWEYINESSRRLLAVTTDDIVRVANTYFDPSNRVVGIYRRKEGAPRGDPALATMDPAQRQMVQQAMAQLAQAPPEQLGLILMTLEAQAAQAPPEAQPVLAYLADWIRDRMEAPTPGADDEDGNGGAP